MKQWIEDFSGVAGTFLVDQPEIHNQISNLVNVCNKLVSLFLCNIYDFLVVDN